MEDKVEGTTPTKDLRRKWWRVVSLVAVGLVCGVLFYGVDALATLFSNPPIVVHQAPSPDKAVTAEIVLYEGNATAEVSRSVILHEGLQSHEVFSISQEAFVAVQWISRRTLLVEYDRPRVPVGASWATKVTSHDDQWEDVHIDYRERQLWHSLSPVSSVTPGKLGGGG